MADGGAEAGSGLSGGAGLKPGVTAATEQIGASLSPGIRRGIYALVIAVAAAQGLASILTASVLYSPTRWPDTKPPYTLLFSANDRSRWCTVWSLVERGTYQIDEIIRVPGWDTIDKVRYQEHFYSSKPPLLSTLVAGAYWILKHSVGLDLLTQTHETVRTILLLINWLPWIVALGLLARMAERYGRSDFSRLFVVLAAAAGTFLTTFLITFNNHTVAATSLVFSLSPALAILIDGRRQWWRFALAGFWGAFVVCNEIPACAYGAILFVLLARCDLRRTCMFFVPAALVPLAGFFYTNWLVTGGVMPFYASFGADTNNYYRYVFEGIPSYWMNPSAVDRGESSALVYLWHCTLGHHGIWSLSPIFLLTVAGWFGLIRRNRSPLRVVTWLSLGLTVWILVFYLLQTKSYNYGGVTSGLRWAFWLIPLWLLAIVPVLDNWGDRGWLRCLSAGLLAVSVFSANWSHLNPWQQPWLQGLWNRQGPPETQVAPEPAARPRPTWFELPQELPENAQDYWVELSGTRGDGRPVHWRLSLDPQSTAELVRVRIASDNDSSPEPQEQYISFDANAWQAGAKLAAVLKSPSEEESQGRQAAIRFLQGLPRPVTYTPGIVRYLKTPLRTDALACRIAVNSPAVTHKASPTASALRYRRAVWWSPEVPFGVAQIEDLVTDPRDGTVVYKQRLTLSRVGAFLAPKDTEGSGIRDQASD